MGWGRGGGPVLGMSIGIIISDQPLDMGELFMQVVIPLLLLLEVMILLSGFILPQDPGSYGIILLGTKSFIPELLLQVSEGSGPLLNEAV